ncbi:Piwi domain-containing protein [Gamsiella multidivaricata]|uniref:Piwi domain-containing protein n=1 Tax=Gamsiella multidivaricata TaxID=101098 RepID=UPI00221FF4CC|nr:Piwi domain-containing protein [Gamsiella multidivaricata]KAI7822858.1 Piwi domain-containing protein [Gamsiella multidivaricata]
MFTIKLVFVAIIDIAELQLFLEKRGPFTTACATAIQALNVILTHKPFSEMINVGRSVYVPEGARDLGGGIEKWDGVFQSIRPGQDACYLNIDTTATAFIKGGNAVEVFGDIARIQDLRRGLSSYDITKIERVLKGCDFTVKHEKSQRRFKLVKLSEKGADRTYFKMVSNDGVSREISVEEYFRQAHGFSLRYPALPCFGAKGRENISYFPAELCFINPGQHYKKKLNEEQVAAMIKTTAIRPDARAQKINSSLRILDFDRNPYLEAFGLRISTRMASVPARILPPPMVQFSSGIQERPNSGVWNLPRSRPFKQGSRLESWGLLVFAREDRVYNSIGKFVRLLVEVLSSVGVVVTATRPPVVYGQVNGDIVREVDSAKRRIEAECRRPPQLLMVILPGKGQIYPMLKAHCETQGRGLMTQCALLPKIERANDQYCRLMACKILTKLGGVVSTLAVNEMPFMERRSTLIIGADVSHPGPGEDSEKPSIASIVASIDDEGYKFIGRVFSQDPRLEVIETLQSTIREIIIAYKRKTNHHPKRILFYRDGVSEGQFAEILRTEVMAIKLACKGLDAKYMPPITFVVVKKRHHARFFPQSNQDRDRSGNCVSGTVVDTVITHPTEFNFYLQSHAGLQGTSRSMLYHVLLDENKFTSDSLQRLTFNLCHMYSRCPRTISIVPAVQYAHMLAYRGRYYLDYAQDRRHDVEFGPIRIAVGLITTALARTVLLFRKLISTSFCFVFIGRHP